MLRTIMIITMIVMIAGCWSLMETLDPSGTSWPWHAMAKFTEVPRSQWCALTCQRLNGTGRPEPPDPRFRCLSGLKGVGNPEALKNILRLLRNS